MIWVGATASTEPSKATERGPLRSQKPVDGIIWLLAIKFVAVYSLGTVSLEKRPVASGEARTGRPSWLCYGLEHLQRFYWVGERALASSIEHDSAPC